MGQCFLHGQNKGKAKVKELILDYGVLFPNDSSEEIDLNEVIGYNKDFIGSFYFKIKETNEISLPFVIDSTNLQEINYRCPHDSFGAFYLGGITLSKVTTTDDGYITWVAHSSNEERPESYSVVIKYVEL